MTSYGKLVKEQYPTRYWSALWVRL